jgi:hypothetical protein
MSDYDDGERPSWREIDKRRDGSRHAGRTESKDKEIKEGPGDRWKSGRVKEALDRLFEGKKGTVEHDKLFTKLHSSYGSDRFLSTVQKYVAKFGLPDDAPSLILIVDAKNQDVAASAMAKLKEIYPTVNARQQEDIRRKLSIVALADASRAMRKEAEEVLASLS